MSWSLSLIGFVNDFNPASGALAYPGAGQRSFILVVVN